MRLWELVAIAALTVGSRVVALVALPPPSGAPARLVRRLPAPLFAALAALSLADGGLRDPALLAAVGCALVAARWGSLLMVLVAGLAGHALVTILL